MNKQVLQDMEKEWKEMAHYLCQNCKDKNLRETVFDRLVWLKMQIDRCKQVNEFDPLLYYFNETVYYYNNTLKLPNDKQFKELK
ncbi:MAG: hypothetical protein COT84_05905 [Chlamydiae bacterium CG10_big_fil_rev_8_21_14_0_10_35_9]|nr:MAG: hypothetical protein COT84_05905 [Chlamydiae bacterium CG10_big_fil_rev_8_21_14_0_10_35_9]